MKIKFLIILALVIVLAISHGNHGKKTEKKATNKTQGHDHHGHNHSHSHSHEHKHDHSHEHDHDEHHESPILGKYNKEVFNFLFEKLSVLPQEQQAYSGAFIISTAPIPIFIIMLIFNSKNVKMLDIFSAFASGALLGDVLFHNLPEVYEDNHVIVTKCIYCNFFLRKETLILGGVLFLFFVEKFLGLFGSAAHVHDANEEHHGHVHSNKFVTFIGDLLHNFTDGLAIGASFSKGKYCDLII
jgi:hypothetical protein